MKRIVTAIFMVLTVSALMFAQRGQPPDPVAGLKAALSLTDAQAEAIKALLQTRQTRAQAIMTEIQQKRQTLETLLNAPTPNPTDVGNAAIALHASEKKLPAERDWFITELKKLLTGEQQQKLDTLLAANPRLPFLGGGGPGQGRAPR